MTIDVKVLGDFRYTVEFIGAGGILLSTQTESVATYRLSGSEVYVRARVTDSFGSHAWIQPVWTIR